MSLPMNSLVRRWAVGPVDKPPVFVVGCGRDLYLELVPLMTICVSERITCEEIERRQEALVSPFFLITKNEGKGG